MANHVLRLVAALALALAHQSVQALNLPLTNYNKNDYRAGSQNWDVVQAADGRIFVANTLGMLTFDGQEWGCHAVGNYTDVRSLCTDEARHRVYAGAFNEFGYFAFDSLTCRTVYVSLSSGLSPDFAEVWHISRTGGNVYFQADHHIFHYEGDTIVRHCFADKLSCSAVVNHVVLCASREKGIRMLSGSMFVQLPQSEVMVGRNVVSIVPWTDGKVLFAPIRLCDARLFGNGLH